MKTSFSLVLRLVLACIVPLALSSCSNGDDIQQWVSQEKAKRGTPMKPLPVIRTFETFLYTDQELRDPFGLSTAEQVAQTETGPHPDQDRPREPLESFPLDGLKMSGTLGATGAIEGLVRDPDGVVHRVHVGNYLGQNYGRITAIEEDRIDLVELVPNGTGGWMERPASIALGDTKQ